MGLFQKKIEPRCAYCAHGRQLSQDEVACPKKGSGSRPGRPNRRAPGSRMRISSCNAEKLCEVFSFTELFSAFSPQKPIRFSPPRPGEGRRGPKVGGFCDMFCFSHRTRHYIMWS